MLDDFFAFPLFCALLPFSFRYWLGCRFWSVGVGSLGALYRFGFDRIGSMTHIRTDGRMAHSLHIYIHMAGVGA